MTSIKFFNNSKNISIYKSNITVTTRPIWPMASSSGFPESIALSSKVIQDKTLGKHDIVIAVMGLTGSGKSNFIDRLSPDTPPRARTGVASVTEKLVATRLLYHPKFANRIVLVDTPGFDDSHRSDADVFELVATWLKKTYKSDIKLAGLLYLHRITDNRLTGSPLNNLRVFCHLCGHRAMEKVILVTSMWDRLSDQAIGRQRECDLESRYWADMIYHGAKTLRFTNTAESAWEILEELIQAERDRMTLLLQEEMIALQKRLNETSAGITLCAYLSRLYEQQKEVTRLTALIQPDDFQEISRPNHRQHEADEILNDIRRQRKRFKIPLSRRFVLLFKGEAFGREVEVCGDSDE